MIPGLPLEAQPVGSGEPGVVTSASAGALATTVRCGVAVDMVPFANGRVVLRGPGPTREVIADRKGWLAVELEPGRWRVSAPDLEARIEETRVTCHAGRSGGGPELEVPAPGGEVLVRFATPWRIDGVVVDAATGEPVRDALVRWRGHEREARSDAAGRFHLSLPEDYPRVDVEAAGYAFASTGLYRGGYGDHEVHARWELRRPLVVEGVVRDLDGRPLAAATVDVRALLPAVSGDGHDNSETSRRAACDGAGRFRLELAPGSWTGTEPRVGPACASALLRASAPGHATTSRTVVVRPGAKDVLEVALPRLIDVSGRVIDPDGAPVAGARVTTDEVTLADGTTVLRANLTAITDRDGRFALAGVPERASFLVARDGAPIARFEAWLPVADLVLRLERSLATPGDVVLGPTARASLVTALFG